MVQMSFRAKAILIPVTKRDSKRKLTLLKAEFGDRLRIVLRGSHITLEGDDIRDWRVRDRIYEISEGRAPAATQKSSAPDRNGRTSPKIKPRPGDWVLLKGDRVIACGKDVARLLRMYDRLRADDLVISKEPVSGLCFYRLWTNPDQKHRPIKPRSLRLKSLGWTKAQIDQARSRLTSFEADWDHPGMEKYDAL